MKLQDAIRIIEQRTNKMLDDLPGIIEMETLKFAKENFNRQSWEGTPWPERKATAWGKKEKSNKPLLVDTGILRNSLNAAETSIEQNKVKIKISSDVPYAPVHNFGFEGEVSQSVGQHERRSKSGKQYFVKAHQRNIKMRIPKRQFVGKSPELETNIKREIKKNINRIFHGL